jgi:hypothetical protein
MQHNLLTVIVELGNRVTPTEIGVQVLKPDREFRRNYDRVKPRRICEHQTNLPCWQATKNNLPTRAATTFSFLPPRQYSITVDEKRLLNALSPLLRVIVARRVPKPWISGKTSISGANQEIADCESLDYRSVTKKDCRLVGTRRNDGV